MSRKIDLEISADCISCRRCDVREFAKQLEHKAGVYVLISDGEAQYVGQSTNLYSRLVFHDRPSKKWDIVGVIPFDKKLLNAIERFVIQEVEPKHNTNGKVSEFPSWGYNV